MSDNSWPQEWPDEPEKTEDDLLRDIIEAPARSQMRMPTVHFGNGGFDGLNLTVSSNESALATGR